ncbi:hypothetical protein ABN763_15610 [Spongiivirga sp. MCCC 1A20706]|uniref:hypothetical protein n=1 Tax=Spongiivirga sp. MCCC 1A20706 TaxID=3160963 RepID=UPI0039779FF4
MNPEKQPHYQVNWIDGMKINKQHFIESENAAVRNSQLATAAHINAFNYGLIPSTSGNNALELDVSLDGQNTVVVQLKHCKAITKNGYNINITPDITEALVKSGNSIDTSMTTEKGDGSYYVVLSVNPFERIPLGDAKPDEEPVRHPFVVPNYQLHIVDEADANEDEFGSYHISIGKIDVVDGKAAVNEEYIPPCTCIDSHEDLKYIYAEIHTFFNVLENYNMNIIQKIYQKKQTNDMARMVMTISQAVVQYFGSMLPEYRLTANGQSPVYLISKIMSLSRVIKNNIDVYAGTGKEELLNYLSDWCDLNQGAFEKVLTEMIELNYQHNDINKSLLYVSNFTKLMASLFKKLNELEYIGKKSDSNIFVKEEVIAKPEVKKRRSFLLD